MLIEISDLGGSRGMGGSGRRIITVEGLNIWLNYEKYWISDGPEPGAPGSGPGARARGPGPGPLGFQDTSVARKGPKNRVVEKHPVPETRDREQVRLRSGVKVRQRR